MPATSKTIQLSSRDLAMIRDIARYKFLSSFQLERLYFAEIKHRRYDPADPSTEVQRANARHRKPRHDLRYTSVHFSRPYPVRSNSNSPNCCVEKDLWACRRRVCGRYNTNDSWGVSGMSTPCGEAKRVG